MSTVFHPTIITTDESQRRFLNAYLNSSMLFNLLMGAYSIVYFGTMHLYITKRGPSLQRRVVMSTITLLYCLCVGVLAIQWHSVQRSMVDYGETRTSSFQASENGPHWIGISNMFLQTLMIIISDGLLIWRCFHLWNRSWRIVAFPIFLTVAEFVLFIAAFTFKIVPRMSITSTNALTSCTCFTTVGATVLTTALIAYRIHIDSPISGKARGRFSHIIQVVLESAAVYALFCLCTAILVATPNAANPSSSLDHMLFFLTGALPIVAGMAPTILVARIAIARHDTAHVATLTPISDIHFEINGEDVLNGQNGRSRRKSSNLIGSEASEASRAHTVDIESGIIVIK